LPSSRNSSFLVTSIRTYVAMVGTSIKIIDIFKLFLKNTNEENSIYLFDWIRKCIKDPAVNKTEISQEIINNLDRLVATIS
jgi:hypothetical protein